MQVQNPEEILETVLVVDDRPDSLKLISSLLTKEGFAIHVAPSGCLALDWLQRNNPDLILLDIRLPDIDGYEVCRRLKADTRLQSIPVIFISGLAEQANTVKAFDVGGVDYVTKPFQAVEVLSRVRTHVNLRRSLLKLQSSYDEIKLLESQLEKENAFLRSEVELKHAHSGVIGQSDAIRKCLRKAEEVAPLESTVLLLGGTGAGKGLMAEAIHKLSSRKDRIMVHVNCAALTPSLIEAELFGCEKGAYTGSLARQIGRFEVADGSTLFLDEVGELPLELQAKLLRVLQDGEFERLGSSKTLKTNARLITASNKNLLNEVNAKRFREDLYYRLNIFPIEIPSLVDRQDDIPALIWHFVGRFAESMGKIVESIPVREMTAAKQYNWPGNIRELKNMVERSLICCNSPVLHLDLPNIRANNLPGTSLDDVQREHILATLERTGWKIRGDSGAARSLGLKATTLEARMKKLDIARGD
ncbi:MAG: sigma-54-dependent Fis family transcriptional regulator [Gammaproteobacteria bacterium]|nr:sigma-54-dependent Fis family transcriptional regulator [Gammaproteobacteria bacterium]